MSVFDPDRIAVYRLARAHSRAVHTLLARIQTRGHADLINQLRRSTASIPANILEAMGEWRPGKRLHYLLIAKGAVWENWAHVDSLVDLALVDIPSIAEIRDLEGQMTALLITTVRNLETTQGVVAED